MGKTVRTTSVEPGMTLEAYVWHTPTNRIPHVVKVLSKEGTHPKTGMTIVMDKFAAESDGVSMSTNVNGTMCRVTFKTVGDDAEIVKPVKTKLSKVENSPVETMPNEEKVSQSPRPKKFKVDSSIVLPPHGTAMNTVHVISTPTGSTINLVWDRNTWNNTDGLVYDARALAAHGFKYVSEKIDSVDNEGE